MFVEQILNQNDLENKGNHSFKFSHSFIFHRVVCRKSAQSLLYNSNTCFVRRPPLFSMHTDANY